MTNKVLDAPENAKPESRYIGSRAGPEERRLIDLAAASEGETRSQFILTASKERARAILAAKFPAALESLGAA